MPELPEVETVRRGLETHLTGRRITHTQLRRADMLTAPRGSRRAGMLLHARIETVQRHGKQLALCATDGRRLILQLGMSGRVGVGNCLPDEPHVHAWWRVEGEYFVWFQDPRRFGGLTALSDASALHEYWARLGPDVVLASPRTLVGAISGTKRSITAALLDQQIIAGVGNIYADEALHRCGVHPEHPVHELSIQSRRSLVACVRSIMREAIKLGGTTFSDHRTVQGHLGGWAHKRRVHGRVGAPCLTCKRPLHASIVAGRTTVWCVGCQRL